MATPTRRNPGANFPSDTGTAVPRSTADPNNPANASVASGDRSGILDWMTYEANHNPNYQIAPGYHMEDGKVVHDEPNFFLQHPWLFPLMGVGAGLGLSAAGVGSAADAAGAAGEATGEAAPGIGGTLDEAAALGDGPAQAASSTIPEDFVGPIDTTAPAQTLSSPLATSLQPDEMLGANAGNVPGAGNIFNFGTKGLSLKDMLALQGISTGGSILAQAMAPKPVQRQPYTGPNDPNATLATVGQLLKALLPNAVAGNQPSGAPGIRGTAINTPTRNALSGILPPDTGNVPGIPGAPTTGAGPGMRDPQLSGALSMLAHAATSGMQKQGTAMPRGGQ